MKNTKRFGMMMIVFMFSMMIANAQVQETILKKHFETVGSEQSWENIQRISCNITHVMGNDTILEKRQLIVGKALRIDYTFKTRNEAMRDKKYFILINEHKGWRYLPDNAKDTLEMLNESEINYNLNDHIFNDALVKNKEVKTIEFINKVLLNDEIQNKFVVEYKSGAKKYVFVGNKSNLITQTMELSSDTEKEFYYKNYQKVNDLLIPFEISNDHEKYLINSIEINKPINEMVFKLK